MVTQLHRALALSLLLTGATACEAITSMVGMAKVAGQLGKYLEDDLKTELTEAKISKAIEVTPLLREFSKSSEAKWELDPQAPDFSKFATAMGAMSDYIAFFETHDTRLTEYYVDMVKIADGRALITLRKAHEESIATHDKEHSELEAKLAAATGEEKDSLAKELERNEKAKASLIKMFEDGQKARVDARKGNSYKLTDQEVARVEARLEEIDAALKKPE